MALENENLNASQLKTPERAFVIEVEVSGDTWEDAITELENLAAHIRDHGPDCKSVSGSPSASHIVKRIKRDANKTPEQYRNELEFYIANRPKAPAAIPIHVTPLGFPNPD